MLYAFIYMKYPEQANLQRQMQTGGFQGVAGEDKGKQLLSGYRISF